MAVTVDDQIEALVSKLNDVSAAWGDSFPATSTGYRRLQKLISDYGRSRVVTVMQYALEARISPQGPSAMPLMIALCRGTEKA